MAISRKEEVRALSADEHELVEKSHHPAVQDLSDADLAGLVKFLRERRDKAQTEAHRRRREIRGKGAPKGATPSKADGGSQFKLAVLAMAMRRLNGEAERRRQLAARVSLVGECAQGTGQEASAPLRTVRISTRAPRTRACGRYQTRRRQAWFGRWSSAGSGKRPRWRRQSATRAEFRCDLCLHGSPPGGLTACEIASLSTRGCG